MKSRVLAFLITALVIAVPLLAQGDRNTRKRIRHAAAMLSNGRLLRANAELKGILVGQPNDADAKLLMAETLRRMSAEAEPTANPAQTIEVLRASLLLNPDAAYTHRDLAKALFLEGHKGEAVDECARAAKLSPDDAGLAAGCGLGVTADRPEFEFAGLAPIEAPTPKKTFWQKHDRLPWFSFVPDPASTPKAREIGLRGTCTLVATVSASGDVTEVAIVKPIGLGLDQIALKTVRSWKFHPGLVNDKPIPAHLVLETAFHAS